MGSSSSSTSISLSEYTGDSAGAASATADVAASLIVDTKDATMSAILGPPAPAADDPAAKYAAISVDAALSTA